jgi:excisionase family DNA binding protein
MEQLIRVKTLAELTGIKQSTLRKWIHKGRCPIPYRRTQGGMLLFSESDVKKWIESLPEIQGEITEELIT